MALWFSKIGDVTRFAAVGFAAIAVGWWVQACVQANWDAADLLPALFMDELVTHNEVERIQNAENIDAYVDAIVGRDQRYGRTHWYLAYAASALGEAGMGTQGQVFFTRMAFAMTLIGGICLLSITFLQSTVMRLIGCVSALATPFSSYYATMPKPEPILLLCFSAFFFLAFRRGHYLGFSFFLLGLAYGTKISALPAVAVLLCYGGLRASLESKSLRAWAGRIALSFAAFAVGAVTAVPIIAARGLEGWKAHLQGTWMNRAHGSDSVNIGPTDWLQYIQNDAFLGNGVVTWAALAIICVAIASVSIAALAEFRNDPTLNRLRKTLAARETEILILFIVALSFIAPIIISVQRLWGFYLFAGFAMLTVAALASGEYFFFRTANRRIKLGVAAATLGVCSVVIYAGGAHSKNYFARMAARSEAATFKENAAIYKAMTDLAAAVKPLSSDGSADVFFDPRLWHPQNSAGMTFKPIWRPFDNWQAKYEVVVLTDRLIDPAAYRPRGTAYDERAAESFESVRRHSDLDGPCAAPPCYRREDGPRPGLHFFIRDDIYTALRQSRDGQ